MACNTVINWTVAVSRESDRALRTHLSERGLDHGDLPRFIEDAVKWSMLDQNVTDARAAFADLPPDELDQLLDEAVAAAREEEAKAP